MRNADDPTRTENSTTTPYDSQPGSHRSMRATSLIVCLVGLLSLALFGPNRVQQLLVGRASEQESSTQTAVANAVAAHSMHYQEAALPSGETEAATTVPRLEPSAHGDSSQTKSLAKENVPPTAVQPAEFLFRETPDSDRDHMQSIQQRLQLLGARYMRLESWGDISPRYRFLCRMPNGNGGLADHEFVSDDPIDAMQRVLYQIEARTATR